MSPFSHCCSCNCCCLQEGVCNPTAIVVVVATVVVYRRECVTLKPMLLLLQLMEVDGHNIFVVVEYCMLFYKGESSDGVGCPKQVFFLLSSCCCFC